MHPPAVTELHDGQQHDDDRQDPAGRRALADLELPERADEEEVGRRSEALLRLRGLDQVYRLERLQGSDQAGPGSERVMPHVRFLNASDGEHVQKWQFKRQAVPIVPIGTDNKTISHYHLAPDGWEDLEGGEQRLCYNEIPTKINWHYLRFDFDLAAMQCTHFQCNDRVFDVSGFDSLRIPAMKNLWCMLNIAFFAETDTDKRAFLYLDSVCLSGDF